MKFLTKHIRYLTASVSSLKFYQNLQQVALKDSLITYLFLIILITTISSTWFIFVTSPIITTQLLKSIDNLVQQYPTDLVVQWDGRNLNANLSPVVFKTPSHLLTQSYGLPENLLIVNTDQKPIDQHALWLITDQTFVMSFQGQTTQALELSNLFTTPFSIDQVVITNFQPQLENAFVEFMTILRLLAFPVMLIFLIISRLFMLLIESGLVWLLIKLNRIKLKYPHIVQLCIHLFIPAEIVHQVALRVQLNLPFSFHSLAFWVILMFILFNSQPFTKKKI